MKRNRDVTSLTAGFSLLALLISACTANTPETPGDAAASPVLRNEASCENLAGTTIAGTVIETAVHVKEGDTVIDNPPFTLSSTSDFCRVGVSLSSGPGSAIRAEYWLPDTWNRKFYAVGGGGFNGGLDSAALVLRRPLAAGYAGAANDAGHPTAEGASWAFNEPARLADWGYKANHLTAEFGKALIGSYYDEGLERSYFEGCSNGGRDALILAQRFPDDFDGIISGAPAAHWTPLMSSFVMNQSVLRQGFSGPDAEAKYEAVHAAVLEKCDLLDGVGDGVLENPLACSFDPAELLCGDDREGTCLSESEADALRAIYQGHQFSDGRRLYPGYRPGGEHLAEGWRNTTDAGISQMGTEFYRWMVHGDPEWTSEQFNLDTDYLASRERMDQYVDASDADLHAFADRGGRLLLWHGWNDTFIPGDATIEYYEAVKGTLGAGADTHVRLFMAPGVNHCFLGDGPSVFDKLGTLDKWVESGEAPDRIIATKYDNDFFALVGLPASTVRTRPLCPWPQTAHYAGSGSTDEAANFTCKAD